MGSGLFGLPNRTQPFSRADGCVLEDTHTHLYTHTHTHTHTHHKHTHTLTHTRAHAHAHTDAHTQTDTHTHTHTQTHTRPFCVAAGKVINVETLVTRFTWGKDAPDPDRCQWEEDRRRATHSAAVLRVFLRDNVRPAGETVGTRHGVPCCALVCELSLGLVMKAQNEGSSGRLRV